MAAETIRGAVPPRKVSKKDEVINLRAIIVSYLSYWPYTIVSIILCFVVATLFLKRAKPSYQIKATVVLQGNANNKANDPKAQDINISNTIAVNVEDEIEFLKSRTLTRLAIDSLQLGVTYVLKTGAETSDPLYDKSPIKFQSIKIQNQALLLRETLVHRKRYLIILFLWMTICGCNLIIYWRYGQ